MFVLLYGSKIFRNAFWIECQYKNAFLAAGRRPSPDLHVDRWSSAGVQQAGEPQCTDVFSVSALPFTCQSSLELELSSSKLYPFNNWIVLCGDFHRWLNYDSKSLKYASFVKHIVERIKFFGFYNATEQYYLLLTTL